MSSDAVPRKRRGRPPVDPDATPTRVLVTLSAKQYDDLFQRAQTKAISIPELMRRSCCGPTKRDK